MAKIETQSWGSRLAKSIMGALFGIVLFFIAFPLLIYNEYLSVQRIRTLEEGAGKCQTVAVDKIDPANNGNLVHTTGQATTTEILKDPQFGVSANALLVKRKVEIYQWQERSESKSEKQVGGKEVTVTKYYHDKKWLEKPESSAGFHVDDNTGELYVNVGTMPYSNDKVYAQDPKLGAFKLTTAQVDMLDKKVLPQDKTLPVTTAMLASLPKDVKDHGQLTVVDGAFYLQYKTKPDVIAPGDDEKPPKKEEKLPKDDKKQPKEEKGLSKEDEDQPKEDKDQPKEDKKLPKEDKNTEEDASGPQIGDVRVTFEVIKPQKVSVLAKQDNGSLMEWGSSNGDKIYALRVGELNKDQMFEEEQKENTARTWLLRLAGFALMAGGIFLVSRPIAVFGDFFPMLGGIVEVMLIIFAVILALPLTLVTIAIAWVVVRPLIAIPILVVGVLLLGVGIWFILSRRRAKPAVAKV